MTSFSKIKTFYILIFTVIFALSELFLTVYAVQYIERIIMNQRYEQNNILAQLALEAVRHVDPDKDMTEVRVQLLQRLAMMRFFDEQSFLCAIDTTGHVFAHLNPAMIGMYQGDQFIETADGRLPYIGEAYRVEGLWDNPASSTVEIVSTLVDPDSRITIAVHQNKSVVDLQVRTIRMYLIVGSLVIFGSLFVIGLYATQKVIGHYVDDIEQAESELHDAKDSAEAANRAKSDFLARMSHELRTPLNGILGYTQLMNRDPNLEPPHKEGAAIIQKSGEHLLELINDILDLSKIEARRMDLRLADFDLHECLQNIVDLFTVRAREQGLAFTFEMSDEVPRMINGDGQKLRQVLINLLGNAVKFTESGEVRLSVSMPAQEEESGGVGKVTKEGTSLHFSVEDTGTGIAADQLESIFQPFSQIEERSKSAEGTGLGLTISREFVRMMGGELDVSSTPGKGTSFSFRLNCTRTDEDSSNSQRTPQPAIPLEKLKLPEHPMTAPSVEVLNDLLALAQRGDVGGIEQELNALGVDEGLHEAFSERLRTLLKRYEIREIRDLLEYHLRNKA